MVSLVISLFMFSLSLLCSPSTSCSWASSPSFCLSWAPRLSSTAALLEPNLAVS